MPVTNPNNKIIYNCNGAQLVFPYTFRIFQDSDLVVSLYTIATGATSLLVLNTDYSVSGAGEELGGNVTLLIAAPSSSYKLIIQRILPITQLIDFVEYDIHPADAHDDGLDKLTMICQQLAEIMGRAIIFDPTITGVSNVMPIPQANFILGWNPTATALTNIDPASYGLSGVSGYSGYSGTSGYSGYSGAGATIGKGTFINGDLVAGILTITHSMGLTAPYQIILDIFDNNAQKIDITDLVTGYTNTVTVDLTSFGTIAGTWGYIYIA